MIRLLRALRWGCLATSLLWGASPEAFYVNYDVKVPTAALRLHRVSIVHPEAEVDLAAAHAAGNRVLAYLSVGELASDASYRARALQKGLRFRGRNEIWGSDILDLSDRRWIDLLVDEVAGQALAQGYDGFFLDTLDSIAPSDRAGGIELLRRLRAKAPDGYILANRGFELLGELGEAIDGVLVESVFGTFDFEQSIYKPVTVPDTAYLVDRLQRLERTGLDVFVLDYADPVDAAGAQSIARRIMEKGWSAFVSTPELQGAVLAPWREVPRRVFSLYGNMAVEANDQILWPVDSFTFLRIQTPLEWLGYEVDYGKVELGVPLRDLGPETAAVIIPKGWEIPLIEEGRVVDWLIKQKQNGKKLVFFGAFTFADEAHLKRLMVALGLDGTGVRLASVKNLKIAASDASIMENSETRLRLLPTDFQNLKAPKGSRLIHAVSAESADGKPIRHDAIFATSWGGVALDPYLTFQRPDFRELWQFDIFAFFEAVLGRVNAPLPDSTTKAGKRIFLSHIDGDGFVNKSETTLGKYSSEVVRDEILKKYPFPVTVSIIEAEVRVLIEGVDPQLAPKFEEIARDIFKLPNVEIASHSYSHPFMWIPNDRTAYLYNRANLKLTEPYPNVDLAREIEGSVNYINSQLAPPGKQVKVFLWSGNCRPPPEALRRVHDLGLVAMNGGDTLISRRVPTVNAIAPRSISWGDELQVLAPNQNENVYTNNWEGPFFGTFVNVIETFDRTESPRRLKPVDIYYHFYSADFFASLRALQVIHDWALEQDLHAITVSQYVNLARDARESSLYHKGDDEWAMINRGDLQTFRVPLAWVDRIDISQSKGLLGWVADQGVVYVHTRGMPVSTLKLVPSGTIAPLHWRLESSSGPIKFEVLKDGEMKFAVNDLRPVTVVLGGFAANESLVVSVDGEAEVRQAGNDGRISLKLINRAEIAVRKNL